MELEKIRQIAASQMQNRKSHDWKERGNKYYHGVRVASLALTLRGIILPDDSSRDDVLTVAAWFHDIENGEDNSKHGVRGAAVTRGLLAELCRPDELDTICEMIAVHDDRKCDRSSMPVLTKILQDADQLDHYGTYDLWMLFLYAVPHDMTIVDIRRHLLDEHPVDVENNRRQFNFEISKRIFDDKEAFITDFTSRFEAEADGRIYGLERLLKDCSEGTPSDL